MLTLKLIRFYKLLGLFEGQMNYLRLGIIISITLLFGKEVASNRYSTLISINKKSFEWAESRLHIVVLGLLCNLLNCGEHK